MTSRSASPRRRHILSSINPDKEHAGTSSGRRRASRSPARRRDGSADGEASGPSRTKQAATEEGEEDGEVDGDSRRRRHRDRHRDHDHDRKRDYGDDQHYKSDDELRPRSKKFRFKKRSHRDRDGDRDGDGEAKDAASSGTSRRSHRRRQRGTRSATPPNEHEPRALSPDTAFRESLFDAMADDEGAAYWEGVYGQPVHVYAAEAAAAAGAAGGELEQMTDEEYAAHVRRRMWEKTHEGLLEERRLREEARRREGEEARRRRREEARRERAAREVEESLRRGRERRGRRERRARWEAYRAAWAALEAGDGGRERDAEALPWPTASGRRAEVREEGAVRRFFEDGLEREEEKGREAEAEADGGGGGGGGDPARVLREERVRWHPDKMQGRAAGGRVDADVLADVTAVFQVVDGLWSERRGRGRAA